MIIQTQDNGSVIFVEKGQLIATATKSKWKQGTWDLELADTGGWTIYEIESMEEGEKLLLG